MQCICLKSLRLFKLINFAFSGIRLKKFKAYCLRFVSAKKQKLHIYVYIYIYIYIYIYTYIYIERERERESYLIPYIHCNKCCPAKKSNKHQLGKEIDDIDVTLTRNYGSN